MAIWVNSFDMSCSSCCVENLGALALSVEMMLSRSKVWDIIRVPLTKAGDSSSCSFPGVSSKMRSFP